MKIAVLVTSEEWEILWYSVREGLQPDTSEYQMHYRSMLICLSYQYLICSIVTKKSVEERS